MSKREKTVEEMDAIERANPQYWRDLRAALESAFSGPSIVLRPEDAREYFMSVVDDE